MGSRPACLCLQKYRHVADSALSKCRRGVIQLWLDLSATVFPQNSEFAQMPWTADATVHSHTVQSITCRQYTSMHKHYIVA